MLSYNVQTKYKENHQFFRADVKKLNFRVKIRFPKILITALYEVRGRFLSLNLQGNGPIAVTAGGIIVYNSLPSIL